MENESVSQYQMIIDAYKENSSIKEIAENLGVSVTKVRRVLITEGLWSSRSSRKVGELHQQGLSTGEIAEQLGISDKAVESYLPYSKGVYGDNNRSGSAARSEAYRDRNAAAADRQVGTSYDKEMIAIKNEIVREAVCEPKNEDPDREIRAILLHLELDTAMLPSKDLAILNRYGRVEKGLTRDIIVPAGISLHALHYAIQRVFGWQNSHLHHYKLPKETFKALVGTDEMFKDWKELCGLYFRFPTQDMEDLCWDDDYDGEESVKTWMRRKYSAPYYYGGFNEHYIESQLSMLTFCRDNPKVSVYPGIWESEGNTKQSVVEKALDQLTVRELGQRLDADPEELLERLTVKELLFPEGGRLSPDRIAAVKQLAEQQRGVFAEKVGIIQQYHRKIIDACELIETAHEKGMCDYNSALVEYENIINRTETKAVPITDTLLYEYDYGDSWAVRITCKEMYPVEIGEDDPIMSGYRIIPATEEQVFNDVRVFDRMRHKITGVLRDQVATVIAKMRPLCIAADGLSVMDDVGGIGGYCDFLTTIHEANDDKANEMKEWARGMGWTGRKTKPESML